MSSASEVRHFLSILDLDREEHLGLIERAIELKAMQYAGEIYEPLKNRTLGMIFEKSSTRTRVAFEVAMVQFGGAAIFLSPRDTQLGRGEPVEDSARVVSRMVDCVMIRTYSHALVERFAHHARVPVINALTDRHHPCQLLADMQTYREHRGSIQGRNVAWIGDGNNMCHSYIETARRYRFKLRIACPKGYEPDAEILSANSEWAEVVDSPQEAATGADLLVTDVWASMGQEEEAETRHRVFEPYQVNTQLMSLTADDALFMHCLPAYRASSQSATCSPISGAS